MTHVLKIKKINAVNKDRESPEIEYKQKQINRTVFEQNSFESSNCSGKKLTQ